MNENLNNNYEPQETVEVQNNYESQETVEAQNNYESQETVEVQNNYELQDNVEAQNNYELQDNVEVQNNYEPQNNTELQMDNILVNNNESGSNYFVEKPKKNKKPLLIVGIVLLLIICALIAYKFFVYDKKKDNTKDNTNEKKVYEKINYEIREKKIYIDGNEVTSINGIADEVKEFNDLLVIKFVSPKPSIKIVAIDKNQSVTEFDYLDGSYDVDLLKVDYSVDNDYVYITVHKELGNGDNWYCNYENKSEVVEYTVKYKYLGDRKFSKKELTTEKTVLEAYEDELKNCSLSTES